MDLQQILHDVPGEFFPEREGRLSCEIRFKDEDSK